MNKAEGKDTKMRTDINSMKPQKVKEEKIFFDALGGDIKIIHDDFLTTNLRNL